MVQPRGWPARDSDLIAGCTVWLRALGMVSATVDLPILVEVDHINQELIADGAYVAWWVPVHPVASVRREPSDVPAINLASAL